MVRLISVTPNAEKTVMYCARVSNPLNQDKDNPGLINYCIKHGHWSIFEMAHMTIEIKTSRAISAQILRHKSFSFQEFSQRYCEAQGFEFYNARRQDTKDRQNSIDDLSEDVQNWFLDAQSQLALFSNDLYSKALEKGIAKECARFLLPLNTTSKLYMSGSLRSWLHYLDLRCGNGTQLEHQEIAKEIKKVFIEQFPIIAKAKGWLENEKV